MDRSQAKVLVVDDEQFVRRNIEKMLVKAGYVVRTASNGEQTLDALDNDTFDLVILDIMMPDWTGKLSKRTGVDILKQIQIRHSHIPVIMLSASENIELAVEAMKHGAYNYLVKGNVNSQEFTQMIKDTLDKHTSAVLSGISEKTLLSGFKKWFIARSSSILDEVLTAFIVTGILYVFGVVTGKLQGTPLTWLTDSRRYLIGSVIVIIFALSTYIAWQHKHRK